ncbi:aminotransferase class V-fold PLP-dependent enzyme [Mycoplasma sp. 744]|uniref:aminotransferase class V-fold PLP-dependent enzyme n=1 Tax=Mycoplasma sp. 744 TaxID=3108531 RepID=UPI002B1D7489|nr:aminotransferase class V-fold PLP-dependent enzyme [Mycoplasma sp. 744]MEA4115603.1 aminotransferase class V-fold PLP-dependent enzyme [Mycoplasma sp. 744]
MKNIRKYFPLLKKITFLDNSALCQKPIQAINKEKSFYLEYAVSTRTSDSSIGIKNNLIIKEVKEKVKELINANKNDYIIFTSGATDSLNKIALMLKDKIQNNQEILISAYNHSSNIAPWIKIAKDKGAIIKFSENILEDINENTVIVAISQVSNSFYHPINMKKIKEKAQLYNSIIVNDAAQAIVSEKVDMKNSDIVVFSTNKFYGPTGLGILAINDKVQKLIDPVFVGGGTIDRIDNCELTIKNGETAFEPGTPNLAAIYMFDAALDFFKKYINYENTKIKLTKLTKYLYKQLLEINNLEIYTPIESHIIIFNIKNISAQDVAHYLATQNIYVRSGIFCAQYLKNIKKENSFVRISLGVYNNYNDCKKILQALKNGGDFLVL